MTVWRAIPALTAGAAWAWLAAVAGSAAEPTFQVGERVVLRGRAPLWVDGHVAADPAEFRLDRVDRVNGGKLWLVADNAAGWARARQVQQVDAAIRAASRAIEADPSAYHSLRRALTWDAPGKVDLAIADNTEALRIEPDNRTGLINRGLAWTRKHDPGRAIADLDAALRLRPDYVAALANRGWTLDSRGEYVEAAEAEALRLDPNFGGAFGHQAWQWATCPDERFRDGRKAVVAATRALELGDRSDRDEPGRRATLAAAYAEVGDFARAVEWQEKALALTTDPADRARAEARLAIYRDRKPVRAAP